MFYCDRVTCIDDREDYLQFLKTVFVAVVVNFIFTQPQQQVEQVCVMVDFPQLLLLLSFYPLF